jgi:hypothetical protein
LVDAANSPWAERADFLGHMVSRDEALSSSLKTEVFVILDAVGDQDERLSGWWLHGR